MKYIQQLAAEAALKKMQDAGFFDLCTIDAIIKARGVVPDPDAYKTLRLLHCVHFKDMKRELLEALPVLLRMVLNGPGLELTTSLAPAGDDRGRWLT